MSDLRRALPHGAIRACPPDSRVHITGPLRLHPYLNQLLRYIFTLLLIRMHHHLSPSRVNSQSAGNHSKALWFLNFSTDFRYRLYDSIHHWVFSNCDKQDFKVSKHFQVCLDVFHCPVCRSLRERTETFLPAWLFCPPFKHHATSRSFPGR